MQEAGSRILKRHDSSPAIIWIGAVLALMVAGAVCRLHFLGWPLRYDEAFTFGKFISRGFLTILTNYSHPNNHILFNELAHISWRLFGNVEWALRLPALVFGLLVVPATFVVVEEMYDRQAALLSAALTSTSSMLVGFSANARGYSIVTVLFLMQFYLAMRLKRNPSKAGWGLFALNAALMLFTVPTLIYGLGAIGLWLLLSILVGDVANGRKSAFLSLAASVAGALAITLLFYLPLILTSGLEALTQNRFIRQLEQPEFQRTLTREIGRIWIGWTNDLPLVVAWLLVLGVVVSIALHRRLSRDRIHLAIPAIVFGLSLVLYHRVVPPARAMQFFLPIAYGMATAGCIALLRMIPGWRARPTRSGAWAASAIILACGLAPFVLASTAPYYTEQGTFRDSKNVAAFLEQRLTEDDRVVTIAPSGPPLQFAFLQRNMPRITFSERASARMFLVVNRTFRGQTIDKVIQEREIDPALWSEPRLLQSFSESDLYEMTLR